VIVRQVGYLPELFHVILTSTAFRVARDAECLHSTNIVSSCTTTWLLLFLSLLLSVHF